MKKSRFIFGVLLITNCYQSANAGMPVFDASAFGNTIQQVQQGVQQIQGQANQLIEMKNQVVNQLQQIKQLQDQLTNLSGVSGIGNLAETARNILPRDLSSATSFGNSNSIQDANKIIDLSSTSIDPNSTQGQLYTKEREQVAVNLAAIQTSYQSSYDRINNLQSLVAQIEQSPSAKNIADLQARIQAEQAFLQNESNQLAAMSQMQNVQQTVNQQREKEAALKNTMRTPRQGIN
jgi:type IV secretion system protein VirB5